MKRQEKIVIIFEKLVIKTSDNLNSVCESHENTDSGISYDNETKRKLKK